MKTLNRFIIEKLKLGKDVQINNYNFYPENYNELRSLIKQLLEERGPDANLNDIDVSQVTLFYNEHTDIGLFEKLDPHNIDISEWNVSNVKYMCGVFYKCKNFNCDLSKWDVSKVENMGFMFFDCGKFTGKGLENWDVSNVRFMSGMFGYCNSLINTPSWYEL